MNQVLRRVVAGECPSMLLPIEAVNRIEEDFRLEARHKSEAAEGGLTFKVGAFPSYRPRARHRMGRRLLAVGILLGLSALGATATASGQSSHDPDPAAPVLQPSQMAKAPPLDPHPVVALTFDDLPAAGSLPPGQSRTKIAATLAAELVSNHLAGTYGFVNSAKLQNDPDARQALHLWVDAGMNIGSHTWSHLSLTANTAEAFEKEIALNEPALIQYAGKRDWHWFRYPYLWEGDTLDKRRAVRTYLHEHGYQVAQVTLDFEDYAWNDTYARCSAKQDDAAITWLKQSNAYPVASTCHYM